MTESSTSPPVSIPNRPVLIPPEGAPKVAAAIVGVMRDIPKIQKSGFNKEHKYSFVESTVLTAHVQDAMVKNNLVMVAREMSRSVLTGILFIRYEFDLYCEDQAIINVGSFTGSCRFEFKSGSADDKAATKCHTSALKGMSIGLFRIPADVDDIERDDDARSRPQRTERAAAGNGEDHQQPPEEDGVRPMREVVQMVRAASDRDAADEILLANERSLRGRQDDALYTFIVDEYRRRWNSDLPRLNP